MKLYLDASALVKRYVAEPGSDLVRTAMDEAGSWYICRPGYVETARAIGIVAGPSASRAMRSEWSAFGVVEIDQPLVEHAATLALEQGLRTLDSLHLAAALLLASSSDLTFATWDRRLHAAAGQLGLETLPEAID